MAFRAEMGVEETVDEEAQSGALKEDDGPLELEVEPPCVILRCALGGTLPSITATLGSARLFGMEIFPGGAAGVDVEDPVDNGARFGFLGEDDGICFIGFLGEDDGI
eukprot:CAMPEP_0184337932 /NCGR_PEP_ID=MMETSP1089-20130417/6424_1 /TAXON_ID=38269 ORGANISM="Gloeochaete wittrockiana, Strain SAG46.84" /NCGR_SAMPLE_ID=MMETSP1089 /ASSEMBLY_ACC=CAM_ASM_000445 /LENGTH=106 /DNA_ID=CAMNT_0026664091 /DNA_START=369 /DNA_END=689 /DNA_ORIENTATION=-